MANTEVAKTPSLRDVALITYSQKYGNVPMSELRALSFLLDGMPEGQYPTRLEVIRTQRKMRSPR